MKKFIIRNYGGFTLVISLLLAVVVMAKHIRNTPEDNVIQWQKAVPEGEAFSHKIVSCDPNGQDVPDNYIIITTDFMPLGMVLTETYPICVEGDCPVPDANICNPNSIVYGADIEWTPTYEQAGTFLVLITCKDKAENEDNKWLEITVGEVDNTAPFLLD